MEDDVRVVNLQMFSNRQSLALKYFCERSVGRAPHGGAAGDQFQSSTESGSQDGFRRTQGAMKVHLTKHIVARLQIFLDGVNTTRGYVHTIVSDIDLKRIDNP